MMTESWRGTLELDGDGSGGASEGPWLLAGTDDMGADEEEGQDPGRHKRGSTRRTQNSGRRGGNDGTVLTTALLLR